MGVIFNYCRSIFGVFLMIERIWVFSLPIYDSSTFAGCFPLHNVFTIIQFSPFFFIFPQTNGMKWGGVLYLTQKTVGRLVS